MEEKNKIRLDLIISKLYGLSRKKAAELVEGGFVYVNERLIKKKDSLYNINEEIRVEEEGLVEKQNIKPEINYIEVSEDFIILEKPRGLSVSRTINTPKNELVLNEIVKEEYGLSRARREEEFGLVHRLDKETEGLMILSRTEKYYKLLLEAFSEKKVKKIYLAVITFKKNKKLKEKKEDRVILDLIYGKDKVFVSKNKQEGLKSITSYKLIEEYTLNEENFGILEVSIETGRTHQIRVVLAHLGMPILGDKLYGGRDFENLMLFSSQLSIKELEVYASLYKKQLHDIKNYLMYI